MKIYGKLVLGIGLVVLMLYGSMAFIAKQAFTIVNYKALHLEALEVLSSWDIVQVQSQSLLVADRPLSVLEEKWQASIEDFKEKLQILTENKMLARLSKEVAGLIKNTEALWKITYDQLLVSEKNLNDFQTYVVVNHQEELDTREEGLVTKVYRMQAEETIPMSEFYYFHALNVGLQRVLISNDAFRNILGRLVLGIEEDVQKISTQTVFIGITLATLIFILTFIYISVFSRRLSRRSQTLEQTMSRIAQHDFATEIPSLGKDELGLLSVHLRSLASSMTDIFTAVKYSVENVTTLKDALSAGTTQSAAAVNEINKNIESIKNQFIILNSSIDQAGAGLQDIAKHLDNFRTESSAQTNLMEEAGKDLENAVKAVLGVSEEIEEKAQGADILRNVVLDGSERVQATNEIIRAVSRDIEGIAEVIELIDQISDQTNILSMNAAIESAHAGAAGKGFAVVAEEIRKLAESTQDNAQRIDNALRSIIDQMKRALNISESSAEAFNSINADVDAFVTDLQNIASVAKQSSAQNVEVSDAIKESIQASLRLSQGTEDMSMRHHAILDAMDNIQAISEEALLGITEIDAGSQEILQNAISLEEMGVESRDRITELEAAISGIQISESDKTSETDKSMGLSASKAVEVKEAPETVDTDTEEEGFNSSLDSDGLKALAREI